MCREDVCEHVRVEKIVQMFKTRNATAMPACNATVRVVLTNAADTAVGAWLWAYGIGYLRIKSFNGETSEVELENPCLETSCGDQAPPGTPIPSCTPFVLTPPPCGAAGGSGIPSLYPYLNSGFVAPANGDCVDISVTTVNGLSVGKSITILGGTYTINAITSGTVVNICNAGAGLAAGVVVDYKDSNGNLIVPIVLIDTNPCTLTGASIGKMLVCNGGVVQPLVGVENGQVPVYDAASGQVDFRTLGIPTINCTTLAIGFTLDHLYAPGTLYLISVMDTSGFTGGDYILISGERFQVDTVVNASAMRILPIDWPGINDETFMAGITVCQADCCSRLDVVEDIVLANSQSLMQAGVGAANFSGGALPTLGSVLSATTETVATVTNVNPTRNLNVCVFARSLISLMPVTVGGTSGVAMQVTHNGGSYSTVYQVARGSDDSIQVVGGTFYSFVLAGGASATIDVRAISAGDAGNIVSYQYPQAFIIGVPA